MTCREDHPPRYSETIWNNCGCNWRTIEWNVIRQAWALLAHGSPCSAFLYSNIGANFNALFINGFSLPPFYELSRALESTLVPACLFRILLSVLIVFASSTPRFHYQQNFKRRNLNKSSERQANASAFPAGLGSLGTSHRAAEFRLRLGNPQFSARLRWYCRAWVTWCVATGHWIC